METTQNNAGNSVLPPVITGANVDSPMFSAFKADKAISFIRPYDPKATLIDGYRHSVVRYRDTTKGVSVKPAKMVTIPQVKLPLSEVVLADMGQKMVQVLIGVLEDQQDAMVRELIDSGVSVINWSDLSVEKCFEALTATRVSSRLTRESIEAWVKVAMLESLTSRAKEISRNQGFDAEKTAQQIAKTINSYATNYGALAAAVPNLGKETAEILQSRLSESSLDDDMANALKRKLHAILHPVISSSGDL